MASQLACDLSNKIAAIAPVVGVRFPMTSDNPPHTVQCEPGRPVPVLAIHGAWDPINVLSDTPPPDAASLPAVVGTPVLPIFSREQYEQELAWKADYINVPLDQMTGYTDVMFDQPVVGEPSRATQETYALLDVPVQAVLTDRNADIPALLAAANEQAQALLDE